MKAIIGTEDDIIGFGLTGIQQKICVDKESTTQEIQQHINSLNKETTLCLINEKALSKIETKPESITFIKIPNHQEAPEIEKIQKIAKETLGINI